MKKRLLLILSFAKPHWCKFILLFLCIIITTFSGTTYPYLLGKLVDEVIYTKNMSSFINIVLLYCGVYFINQLLHTTLNITYANLMTKFLYDIRKTIYSKVLSYNGLVLSGLHSGDIIYRMGSDTEQFMNYIHWNSFYLFARIFRLIISIIFIAYLSWPIAIFTVVITPIAVYTSRYFAKKVKNIYRNISKSNGLLSSWLFEIIQGMNEVKLLHATKSILCDYVGKSIKLIRLNINANKIEIVSERINSGLSLFWQLILYGISAYFIYNGKLTIGGFTACVSYFGSCIAAFGSFNRQLSGISSNMVGVDRVYNVLNEQSEREGGESIDISCGNIEFKDVCFSYNKEIEVLKKVSFKVSCGDRIAIVGRSGEGKSTIANMLIGLYQADSGEIIIDNKNLSKVNLHSLRKQIGIVNQDIILFDETIRYNLIFTNDNSRDMEIRSALERAHLHDFIASLPDGIDTLIGVGGRSLSGGQKQRLAVARIFLKNPKILIFDEATSSLDSEAEQVIIKSWNTLCEGRTIIIIAHRLSTILNVDKILVLENGKVAGYDIHEKLLKTCKTYSELFREHAINMQEASFHA